MYIPLGRFYVNSIFVFAADMVKQILIFQMRMFLSYRLSIFITIKGCCFKYVNSISCILFRVKVTKSMIDLIFSHGSELRNAL